MPKPNLGERFEHVIHGVCRVTGDRGDGALDFRTGRDGTGARYWTPSSLVEQVVVRTIPSDPTEPEVQP